MFPSSNIKAVALCIRIYLINNVISDKRPTFVLCFFTNSYVASFLSQFICSFKSSNVYNSCFLQIDLWSSCLVMTDQRVSDLTLCVEFQSTSNLKWLMKKHPTASWRTVQSVMCNTCFQIKHGINQSLKMVWDNFDPKVSYDTFIWTYQVVYMLSKKDFKL